MPNSAATSFEPVSLVTAMLFLSWLQFCGIVQEEFVRSASDPEFPALRRSSSPPGVGFQFRFCCLA